MELMKKQTLKWGFHKEDRELYRQMIASLNLGLEDRLLQKGDSSNKDQEINKGKQSETIELQKQEV